MEIHQPIYLKNGSTGALADALGNIPQGSTLVILVAEGGQPDLEKINHTLQHSGFQYAGALFPKIVFGNKVHDEGLVIAPLSIEHDAIVINGLDDGLFNLQDLPDVSELQDHSLLILLDGLSGRIAEFLRHLYGMYGANVVYIGGGAGSLTLKQTPCVFSKHGLGQGQAIVIPLGKRIKLGVQHGWQRLMGPLIATEVKNNTIKQINWQNAYSVYREVVENESGRRFTRENFFSISKGYPFGLEKNDAEDIVRDPIMATEDGSLICVGEVPENAILHILKGHPEDLTESARLATETSVGQNKNPLKLSFIVDCISRQLFLEEHFDEELNKINQSLASQGGEVTALGALTLGEISSVGDGFLEFLNKTVVIGTLD